MATFTNKTADEVLNTKAAKAQEPAEPVAGEIVEAEKDVRTDAGDFADISQQQEGAVIVAVREEKLAFLAEYAKVRRFAEAILRKPVTPVTTQKEQVETTEALRQLKTASKHWETLQKKITEPINNLIKIARDMFKPISEKLDTREREFKAAVQRFAEEQERKAKEEQARLQDKARRDQERIGARAEKAEASGDIERAQALREQQAAAATSTPIVQPNIAKTEGANFYTEYLFSIDDPAKLPREYLTPDLQKIRRIVEGTKGEVVIPGVRIWSKKSLRVSAK